MEQTFQDYIFNKHNPRNYYKKKKKYHVYSVINYSSNFRYVISLKKEIKSWIDNSIFLINDEFVQKN